jgi:hypothetical protein
MKRIVRFLPLAVAVAVFGWAADDYFRPPEGQGLAIEPNGPGFSIEPSDYRPDPHPIAGGETTITFQANNRSNHPVRIVGVNKSCGKNCCVGPKREAPYEIRPHVSENFDCTLAVGKPGAFQGQIRVFADDGGVREIILTVSGEAVAAPPEKPTRAAQE